MERDATSGEHDTSTVSGRLDMWSRGSVRCGRTGNTGGVFSRARVRRTWRVLAGHTRVGMGAGALAWCGSAGEGVAQIPRVEPQEPDGESVCRPDRQRPLGTGSLERLLLGRVVAHADRGSFPAPSARSAGAAGRRRPAAGRRRLPTSTLRHAGDEVVTVEQPDSVDLDARQDGMAGQLPDGLPRDASRQRRLCRRERVVRTAALTLSPQRSDPELP